MSAIVGNGYGGRQPNQTAYVKQFYGTNDYGIAFWTFLGNNMTNTTSTIIPSDAGVNVQIDGNLTVVGNAYFKKDITVTGVIYNPSDEILKTNIENITKSEIDDLGKLEPKKYAFKNDDSQLLHYGLIAQDIEKVYPNLVKQDEDSGVKKVNYLELIPLLIGKINKMQDEIDELKTRLKD